jgi:hypothetical protein
MHAAPVELPHGPSGTVQPRRSRLAMVGLIQVVKGGRTWAAPPGGRRPSCSASWDWRNRHAATADLNAPRRSSLQRSDSCGCDLFWAGPRARRGRRRRSGSTVRRSSEPSGAFVDCDTWDTKTCRGETGLPSRRPPRLPTAAPWNCLVANSSALYATRVARRRSGRQRPLPHTTATGTPGTLAPAGWLSE